MLDDLKGLLPECSFLDTSRQTYWYAHAAEVIPYHAIDETLGEYEPALSALGRFTALEVAVSSLCPLHRVQPYAVWRSEDGVGKTEWMLASEGAWRHDARTGTVTECVEISLRSFGYQPISDELFFRLVPGVESEYVDEPRVKDLIFGPFTFGQAEG